MTSVANRLSSMETQVGAVGNITLAMTTVVNEVEQLQDKMPTVEKANLIQRLQALQEGEKDEDEYIPGFVKVMTINSSLHSI